MPGKGADGLPCTHIPQMGRSIPTAGQHLATIGREGYADDIMGMPGKGADNRPRAYIPQPGRLINTASQHLATIRREDCA